jgi:hypothetical protein
MEFKDFRADYYFFTGKASDIARQLALAGLAVVWIFKIQQGVTVTLPRPLLSPAIMFVGALGLDLLHYVFASMVWGAFTQWHRWQKRQEEDEVQEVGWLNVPAICLYWGKLALVCIGYGYLLDYMRAALNVAP